MAKSIVRSLVAGLVALFPMTPAMAGSPVTINNATNSASAPVDATNGVAVYCTTGCLGGAGVTANQGTPNAGGAANAWPIQGAGTAGTPAGAVVTIQGVTGGAAVNSNPDSVADSAAFTGTATSATTLTTFNTTGYAYIEFQFPSAGAGNTFLVDSSNDGTPGVGSTFISVPTYIVSSTTGGAVSGVAPSATSVYVACVSGPTMRIRVGSYTSGTITVVGAEKRGACPVPPLQNVSLYAGSTTLTAGTTNSDALGTAAGSGQLIVNSVGRLYNGTSLSRAYNATQAVTDGTGTGSSSVEEMGRPFSEITTATTTTVKSGATTVHAVNVNTCVSGATVKLYNATTATGTPITITCPANTAGMPTFTYDAYFGTGLTVVTSAATDVTVTYR